MKDSLFDEINELNFLLKVSSGEFNNLPIDKKMVYSFIKTYQDLSRIPTPISAIILPGKKKNTFFLQSTWSLHDLIKSEPTKYSRQYIVQKNETFDVIPGMPTDLSSVSLKAFSKTGRKFATLLKKGKQDDHQYLEIWDSRTKENTFSVHNKKEHGKIWENAQFGCFEWSSNEKFLLYVAEMKQPKSESYFSDKISPSSDDTANEDVTKGEEYIYREDWGEDLVDVHHPVLCILNVETGAAEAFVLPELKNISVGPAVWGPNDESIVFVGLQEIPRRLGSIYCTNRRSSIYSVDVHSKKVDCLSGDHDVSVLSPRFSPDYNYLVYLESKCGGPHDKCKKLIKIDWSSRAKSVVIDVVNSATGGQFPGIYTRELPKRCFSEDGNFIIFSTFWRSKRVIVSVDIRDSSVEQMVIDECFGACELIDIKNNIFIASVSSPNIEPCLVAGEFHCDQKLPISWSYLDLNMPAKISGVSWTIATLKPSNINEKYPDLDYEVIIISPEEKENDVPLILWPHGGPHSALPPQFSLYITSFVKLGYAVCLVNFRGSLGFGEDSINSLPSNVGDQDVKDCHAAAEYVKKFSGLRISDIILMGGSHGGFLVAHLSGQYPDYYKAAILRNPVINISGMVDISDIPDWSYVETGQGDQFDFSASATPDVLSAMWEKSPIKYINNVTLPTLLLLGKNDLRVPPLQGLNYYHILKAKKVPVSLYYYDDNHSLSKTASQSDGFMQIAVWLSKQLSPK